MNKKQGRVLLGCAGAVLFGLTLIVLGMVFPQAYLPLFIAGGIVEGAGILVGLPIAFMDYVGNEKSLKEYQKSKPPIEEMFKSTENEKQEEKQDIVIDEYNSSNVKEEEREL